MNNAVIVWKALAWGMAIFAIHMLVGNFLYVNPFVSSLFERLRVPEVMKGVEDFGGLGRYIGLNSVFGVLFTALYLFLFLACYQVLPGGWFLKGLVFACAAILFRAVPEAFNQFMLFRYPVPLIAVQLVNTSLSLLELALVASFIYLKTGTVPAGG